MVSSWASDWRTTSEGRIADAAAAKSPARNPTMQCRPRSAAEVGG